LVDLTLDEARQKGTDVTSQDAMDIQVPIRDRCSGVDANLSALKSERRQQPDPKYKFLILKGSRCTSDSTQRRNLCLNVSLPMPRDDPAPYRLPSLSIWLKFGDVPESGRGGCIIRAAVLERCGCISYDPDLPNLL